MIRAAKYLGVAPWDLARQPVGWMNLALEVEAAEAWAEAEWLKRNRSGQ